MKFPQVRSLRAVVIALALVAIVPSQAFAQKVALLAADPAGAELVQQRLIETNLFTQVDLIRVDDPAETVSLARLLQYDSVLTWSNAPYAFPDQLGDALADYVDLGHGVVEAPFTLFADATLNLCGRWRAPLQYDAFNYSPSIAGFGGLTLVALQPGHPILAGVNTLNVDVNIGHGELTVLNGQLIAEWSSHDPLVASRVVGPQGGRVIGLNLYPVTALDGGDDAVRLMANALLYATTPETNTNHPPTADAGADQTLEATGPAGAAFTVTGVVSDPDAGDTLTIAWTGTGTVGTNATFSGVLPAPVGVTAVDYTLTLTVSDGNGGTASDTVVITVRDTTGPVLANVPASPLTASATSDAGANVPYGPVTAFDAVDGGRPVTCSKSGLFPIGDTVVTCSSTDTRGNTSSASFTVRVTDVTTPGAMVGDGRVRAGGVTYEFEFAVLEGYRERASFALRVTSSSRNDRFSARTVDFVAFSDDPTVRPGRSYRPQVDTVLFSGTGYWNGRSGYRYEVFAVDQGDYYHRNDTVRICVKAPNGAVVAFVNGQLSSGYIESARLRR